MGLFSKLIFNEQPWLKVVSRIVVIVGAVSQVLVMQLPEIPIFGEVQGYALMIAGWLGLELGSYEKKK